MRRNAGEMVGDVLYHVVTFGVRAFGFHVHGGRNPVVKNYEDQDLEPQWRWCHDCQRETVWDGYRWVLEGGQSYECSRCGAVV